MKTVEIHPSVFFICDECGRDVHLRVVSRRIPTDELPEDMAELVEEGVIGGVDGWACPDTVICPHCKVAFDAEDRTCGAGDDEDAPAGGDGAEAAAARPDLYRVYRMGSDAGSTVGFLLGAGFATLVIALCRGLM